MSIKLDSNAIGQNLGMDFSIPRAKQLEKKVNVSKTSPEIKYDEKTMEKLQTISNIVEQEENRDRVGERIINKAENGKKLSPKEMKYLAEKYPEVYEKYKRAEMEREILKSQLKAARNKAQAATYYSDAIMRAEKTSQDDGEFRMRSGQLRDEYNEYLKTHGYKNKKKYEKEEDKNIGVKSLEVESALAVEGKKNKSFGEKLNIKI